MIRPRSETEAHCAATVPTPGPITDNSAWQSLGPYQGPTVPPYPAYGGLSHSDLRPALRPRIGLRVRVRSGSD
eukprot:762159-Hanusia_phi.AAC.2